MKKPSDDEKARQMVEAFRPLAESAARLDGGKSEKTYEQIMEDFGSRWGGCSLVKPHQEQGRTVLVGEDL